MTETFFTADTHFGHRFVAGLRRDRGWFSADDDELQGTHDAFLIDAWNRTVGPRDEVWVLGDFSFRVPSATIPIFKALRGRKHLVIGNHDPKRIVRDLEWESVHELVSRKFDGGHRAVLCHFPLLTWDRAQYGTWMLHGHSHGGLAAPPTTRMDVGVDLWWGRPFSLDEVTSYMSDKTYGAVDHHA